MSSSNDIKTSELKRHLLKLGEWVKAPSPVLEMVKQLEDEYGGNIAIGNHPELGYFILHDQGFGIGLMWKEKNNNEY